MVRSYQSPLAFKAALEARIRKKASGLRISRFRQLLVFDRFLARVFHDLGNKVILKGGMVLELRLDRARTTKDVDVRIEGSTRGLLERLQQAGRLDLGDWFTFEVSADRKHSEIGGPGVNYKGLRFRVTAKLGGKAYGSTFGFDVGVADALTAEPDVIPGTDFLEFIGIQPTQMRVYPRVTHVAEKLHAYTMPRHRPNGRVKDLPDLALLAQTGSFHSATLRRALEETSRSRDTHDLPANLPPPPEFWEVPYAAMAKTDSLHWTTLAEVYAAAGEFLDPVLSGFAGTWVPDEWRWVARS